MTKEVPLSLAKRFVNMLKHNWHLKLISLVLALILWAGLITQDQSLTRERWFTDVSVTVNGADSLKRNSGLVVLSGLESENLTVRMRAEMPQSKYTSATADLYNPRVELTRITETGEQTLKIITSSTTQNGSVTTLIPDSVTVVVDEYVTNYRVPVVIRVSGKVPTGYYGSQPFADLTTVNVSGPRTIVDAIACVCVDYDQSTVTKRAGRIRTARPYYFEDANGVVIEKTDQVEVTASNVVLRSVTVEQTLYQSRSVKVMTDQLTEGKPADGYTVTGVSVSPARVTAAADVAVLDAMEGLYADGAVDVSGVTESFTATLKLRKESDVPYMSTDSVDVTVTVEPVRTKTVLQRVKLNVLGTEDHRDYTASAKNVSLTLEGPKLKLKQIRAADLTVYVDASGLEAGTYDVPVCVSSQNADLSDVTVTAMPETVELTVKER